MKIVEICPYDMQRPGGVQAHIRDLAKWLEGQGHEVMIIAPPAASGGENTPDVSPLGQAKEINFQGTRFEICRANRSEMKILAQKLDDFGAQVLHLHTPWTPLLPWQVWRKTGLPAIATFHATLPENRKSSLANRLLYRVAGFFMARMRATIVPSISPLRQLENIKGARDLVVLPPSVDLSPWRDAAKTAAHIAPKSTDSTVSILFLGRLEGRKGVEILVEAWKKIRLSLPNATLTIAGSGALEPLVLRQIEQDGDGHLRYCPNPDQKEARALMAAADIFVAPSLYGESFGIVLIEAMAAGAVPVAASNSGYKTVLTGDGRALLVPPNDAAALADKVVELANNPAQRQKLRTWGDRHAASFDIAATGPEFEKIFQTAVAGSPKE